MITDRIGLHSVLLPLQIKLSDLYTLPQSKLLENHTLHSGTYLYSPYMAVPPGVRSVGLTRRAESVKYVNRSKGFYSILIHSN